MAEPRTVDEINEAVAEALSRLDGAMLRTVSFLTGLSIEKLIELGGIDETPSEGTGRDGQGIPAESTSPASPLDGTGPQG